MHYPPNNYRELQRMLKRLGFEKFSHGKHMKFKHPTRKPTDLTKRPFIVISPGRDKTFSQVVIKELIKNFAYTEDEIKNAC